MILPRRSKLRPIAPGIRLRVQQDEVVTGNESEASCRSSPTAFWFLVYFPKEPLPRELRWRFRDQATWQLESRGRSTSRGSRPQVRVHRRPTLGS